jgi:hypothetical protein
MTTPIHIEPANTLEFVRQPGLSVMFMSAHQLHVFNEALPPCLTACADEVAVYGEVAWLDLVRCASPVFSYLQRGLVELGGPNVFGALPGYWLFRNGEVLAWDAGLPNLPELKSTAPSALLAFLWTLATRDPRLLARTLQLAGRAPVAQRIANHFQTALRQPHRERTETNQTESDAQDLSWAYRTLEVSPTASMQDVQRAWRRKRAQYHPDRAANDPAEFARLNHLAQQINRARDVILQHRAGGNPGYA